MSQADFYLRPYRPTDAQAAVALVNAAAMQTLGIRRAVIDSVGNVRLNRYFPVNSKKVVAIDAAGTVVGYGYLATTEQGIISETGGAVQPARWGQGIGTMLLDWAIQQAQLHSVRAPQGIKTVLQTNLFEAEQRAIQLYSAAGFLKVREWAHLVIELTAPPPVAVLPKNLQIRHMNLENDWEVVGPAMDVAFADHWGTIDLTTAEVSSVDEAGELAEVLDLPEDDTYSNTLGYCFVVLDRDKVVGGILCNAKLVERSDSGRVGSLFVDPHYRRHGIGRALMLTAFHTFWQRGVSRIITDTDAASFSDAPKFYTSLGMTLYRREFLYEKTVHAGREVRRLNL